MARQRNMGLDILRAMAMFLVIVLHFVGQGGLLSHAAEGSVKYWLLSAVQIVAFCCVNLYGLTTGYLMCNKAFRLSRVVKLWATTLFWSVAVSCVLFVIFPESRTLIFLYWMVSFEFIKKIPALQRFNDYCKEHKKENDEKD